MDGRSRWVVGCALVLGGCAPTVNATPTEDTETTGASASSSASSTASGVEATTSPGADTSTSPSDPSDDSPPLDTGEFGCPYEQCGPDLYCDDSGVCQPLPDVLPDCEPGRISVTSDLVVEGPTDTRVLGLADVDGVGARELVVLTRSGDVEIRTTDLDLLSTMVLRPGESIEADPTSAVIAGRGGDGFGRILFAEMGQVAVFDGDGAGAFVEATPIDVDWPSALVADDWDGDGDTDLAVLRTLDGEAEVMTYIAGEDGFTAGSTLSIDPSPYSLASAPGADGRDLLVGYTSDIQRLPGDGAGGFGSPTAIPVGHVAVAIGAFRFAGSTGLVAVHGGRESALSIVGPDDEAQRMPVPYGYSNLFGVYGDPGSTGDVILLAGYVEDVYVIVEPQFELPCGARLDSPIVTAFLPGANTPILATPDQLIRVGLQ